MKVSKKIKIIAAVLGIVFIALTAFFFSVNAYVKAFGGKWIISEDEASELDSADCIIVLGCKVKDDGNPSRMLSDRLNCGINLYENGNTKKIIMSGDHGRNEYNEVGVMKSYAVDAGINPDDIFMDHAGFSTYESVYRARKIFGAKKIIIVSQEYHLFRAVFIARKLGLEAYGVSCDNITYANQTFRDLREAAARFKDFFSVIFKPKPTYLGEKISLDGSGASTDD